MSRVCTTCGQVKPLDDFPPDHRAKNGRQAKCRVCINAWMKDHYRRDPVWSMLRRAKTRAKREGFDFNLEPSDIAPLPSVCPVFGTALRLSKTAEAKLAEEQISTYAIAATGPYAAVANLSGGNQQKVLLGRWVTSSGTALILDEPTRGVDIGAKIEIYKIIRQLADRGMAILVISSELPEIIGLCDRVVVISEGRKTGELTGGQITEERVLELAVASNRSDTIHGAAA